MEEIWAGKERASCLRCGRPVGRLPEAEAPICSGCLTAREDMEETRVVVSLLKRHRPYTGDDPELAAALDRAIARVLENLDCRLFGPVPANHHALPESRAARCRVPPPPG
jgi:hypothetical protein